MEEDNKDFHVTHASSQKEGEQRQEGTNYKAIFGKPLSKEEIDKLPGEYDKYGFYILGDGSFYDPDGYFFDTEGYDAYGGYYDDYGYYYPGEEHAEEYYGLYKQAHEQIDKDYEYELDEEGELKEKEVDEKELEKELKKEELMIHVKEREWLEK